MTAGWRSVPHILEISLGRACACPLLTTGCMHSGCKERSGWGLWARAVIHFSPSILLFSLYSTSASFTLSSCLPLPLLLNPLLLSTCPPYSKSLPFVSPCPFSIFLHLFCSLPVSPLHQPHRTAVSLTSYTMDFCSIFILPVLLFT